MYQVSLLACYRNLLRAVTMDECVAEGVREGTSPARYACLGLIDGLSFKRYALRHVRCGTTSRQRGIDASTPFSRVLQRPFARRCDGWTSRRGRTRGNKLGLVCLFGPLAVGLVRWRNDMESRGW